MLAPKSPIFVFFSCRFALHGSVEYACDGDKSYCGILVIIHKLVLSILSEYSESTESTNLCAWEWTTILARGQAKKEQKKERKTIKKEIAYYFQHLIGPLFWMSLISYSSLGPSI